MLCWLVDIGLVGGLAVSVFSKPLALLIGLLIFGAQVLIFPLLPYPRWDTNTQLQSRLSNPAVSISSLQKEYKVISRQ
jgi:hypothetical protein